ncbi:MAG TPA: DUF6544 family protein [Burkholderiaceae bacterium]|nr:DUF6544 family protein [Burkholderiaceae bacterium]
MPWLAWFAVAVALLLVAIAMLSIYGSRRWATVTAALNARLEATRMPSQGAAFHPQEIEGLPDPVRRYLRAVLRPGQAIVTAASIAHAGSFNSSAAGERWKPFTSRQRVIVRRPGFVWNARMPLFPGVAVLVHDAYIAGEGYLHPAIMGVLSLATLRGGEEAARGELMRFLAEAAWYPTALLPRQGVLWEAIDARSARATLADGGITVALTFRFDDAGLIESVHADARGRLDGKRIEQMPWEGRFWNYAVRDGMKVPLQGEVAWLAPQGRKPYWRGTIDTIAYEFAR